jgi:hypothetical protein
MLGGKVSVCSGDVTYIFHVFLEALSFGFLWWVRVPEIIERYFLMLYTHRPFEIGGKLVKNLSLFLISDKGHIVGRVYDGWW